MKIKFLIALCSVVSICVEVYADGEQEVKRGTFPYMAFLYYPDELVVDATGSRFLRGAVLIRPDWLVTSAVGPSIVPGAPNGFPRKTLLARLGAVAIDVNFTHNEDEDEQEREVIQIVRPYNHSATQWWRTDISLMKVLLPFNLTRVVDTTALNYKTVIPEKTCIILIYAKEGNTTEDRSLMQIRVEMLPPGSLNCGSHYIGNTMTCAADSDENKNAVYDPNFCQGNSGGPLVCENEVVGLQTYIDNDCKQPHLYQVLSAWENFITCGTEDKCQEDQCSKICDVINKDPLVTTILAPSKTEAYSETPKTSSETNEASSEATEASFEKLQATLTTTVPSNEPQGTPIIPETIIDDNEITATTPTTSVKSEEATTANISPSVNDTISTQSVSEGEATVTRLWPNEKDPDGRKTLGEAEVDSNGRKPAMQARRHKPVIYSSNSSNASNLSMCLSIFYGFLIILACLI